MQQELLSHCEHVCVGNFSLCTERWLRSVQQTDCVLQFAKCSIYSSIGSVKNVSLKQKKIVYNLSLEEEII